MYTLIDPKQNLPERISDEKYLTLSDDLRPAYRKLKVRGFAAMSPERQKQIASKGGQSSHGGGRKPSSLKSAS